MSELEIIGRASGREHYSAPPSRDDRPLSRKEELSLCEASAVGKITLEGLKRAIRSGELRAERRGRVRIRRGDLNEFLHRL